MDKLKSILLPGAMQGLECVFCKKMCKTMKYCHREIIKHKWANGQTISFVGEVSYYHPDCLTLHVQTQVDEYFSRRMRTL